MAQHISEADCKVLDCKVHVKIIQELSWQATAPMTRPGCWVARLVKTKGACPIRRTLWTAGSLLCMAMLVGCSEPQKAPQPSPRGQFKVETYSQATDPTMQPSSVSESPVPPVIIDDGTKQLIIYTCRHARCETLKDSVESFSSPQGVIQATPQLNVLLINDNATTAQAILKLAEELDRPQPQLLVEARILEITVDSDFEQEMKSLFTQLPDGFKAFWQTSGIVLGTPGADPNPTQGGQITIRPLANDKEYLDLFIRLLVTKGYAKILSSPNLIVHAGSEASIITGEEVPVQSATVVSGSVSTTTIFKRVGIKLHVVPLQIAGQTVKLDINPEVSAVTGYTAPGTSGVSNPIVAVRNVRSTLSMKDGQVLTIGGLLRSEDRKITRKTPGLGDVPGIGLLFQGQRVQTVSTQLIFFLRVKILPEGRQNEFIYHEPGAGMFNLEDTRIVPAQPGTTRSGEPDAMPEPRVIRLAPPPAAEPNEAAPLPDSQPAHVPPSPDQPVPGSLPSPDVGAASTASKGSGTGT